jgi:hypothetical protein
MDETVAKLNETIAATLPRMEFVRKGSAALW